jgi:hypothetical protein
MAELKRKDEQLTTADLAGRKDARTPAERDMRDVDPERPKPVRSENIDSNPRGTMSAVAPPSPVRTDVHAGHEPQPRHDVQPKHDIQHGHEDAAPSALFSESDVTDLRGRWSNVQTGFVDEPRHAVEEADKLVATVMQRLAEGFANERANLEKAWDRGDNISTEDLRVALRRYRSFFDRLLNA